MKLLAPYRFASAPPSDPPIFTGQSLGTLRNDYGNYVGFHWYGAGFGITITELGRWIVSGNSGSHDLVIVDWNTSSIIRTVTLNTAGKTPGDYAWATLGSPLTTGGGEYGVFSLESNGGDQWYNGDTIMTYGGDILFPDSAYNNGSSWVHNNDTSHCYGPVNFRYHL